MHLFKLKCSQNTNCLVFIDAHFLRFILRGIRFIWKNFRSFLIRHLIFFNEKFFSNQVFRIIRSVLKVLSLKIPKYCNIFCFLFNNELINFLLIRISSSHWIFNFNICRFFHLKDFALHVSELIVLFKDKINQCSKQNLNNSLRDSLNMLI